jgi:hypothetical protein
MTFPPNPKMSPCSESPEPAKPSRATRQSMLPDEACGDSQKSRVRQATRSQVRTMQRLGGESFLQTRGHTERHRRPAPPALNRKHHPLLLSQYAQRDVSGCSSILHPHWSCRAGKVSLVGGHPLFLRVTPQGASLPKVIARLVIRLQKDCQEIGPSNRFADSGFPAGG